MVLIAALALLFPLITQNLLWAKFERLSDLKFEFDVAKEGRRTGTLMTKMFAHLEEYPIVGTVASGGVKLKYEGSVFDLMGLNNVIMGHSDGDRKGFKNHAAFDKNVLFLTLPDIVTPSAETIVETEFRPERNDLLESFENRKALRGIYEDRQFQEQYRYARVRADSVCKNVCGLRGFFRNEFLMQLEQDSLHCVEIAQFRP
jgi:hypothetical protein